MAAPLQGTTKPGTSSTHAAKPSKQLRSVDDETLHAMAKRIAYDGLNMASPADIKINAGWEVKRHKPSWSWSLKARALSFTTFKPRDQGRKDLAPVIAFAGTRPHLMGDILTDLEPEGVGHTQFHANKKLIASVKGIFGKKMLEHLVLTGHSLGGALAQMAAAYVFKDCKRIVTFQTAGISGHAATEFRSKAQFVTPPVRFPKVTHWIAYGGVVSAVGPSILLPARFKVIGIDRFMYPPNDATKPLRTDVVTLHRMGLIRVPSREKKLSHRSLQLSTTYDPYQGYRGALNELRKTLGVLVHATLPGYRQPLTEDGMFAYLGISWKGELLVNGRAIQDVNTLFRRLRKAIARLLEATTKCIADIEKVEIRQQRDRRLSRRLRYIRIVKHVLQQTVRKFHLWLMTFALDDNAVHVLALSLNRKNDYIAGKFRPFAKLATPYVGIVVKYRQELVRAGVL